MAITDDDLASWSSRTAGFEVIESTKLMGTKDQQRVRRTVLAFSPKRHAYDVRSLTKQKEKADPVAAGVRPAKQVRFVRKAGGSYVVNEAAYDRALSLAWWKGYVTSLDKDQVPGREVIGFYHELYHVEQAFRKAKTDLKARPMYVSSDDRIHAHLTVVVAALALSQHIYEVSGVTAPRLVEQLGAVRHAVVCLNGADHPIAPRINGQVQELIDALIWWEGTGGLSKIVKVRGYSGAYAAFDARSGF